MQFHKKTIQIIQSNTLPILIQLNHRIIQFFSNFKLKYDYDFKSNSTSPNIQLNNITTEVICLSKIIIPVTLQIMAEWSVLSLALYFAGKLGSMELSSMSLALSCYCITANSVIKSFSMGMESICGHVTH